MRWIPWTAPRSIGHKIAVGTFALVLVHRPPCLPAQAPQVANPSRVRLQEEAAGIDGIGRALISGFDRVDIVALGEAHGRKSDSDLRIALVRHPDFARTVH